MAKEQSETTTKKGFPKRSSRARQEVKSGFGDPWKPNEIGEEIEGTFTGVDKVPINRRGSDKQYFNSYRILPDGADTPIALAGAILDKKFAQIPKGTYVWVTYIGQIATSNGLAHDFKVECEQGTKLVDIDDDNIPY